MGWFDRAVWVIPMGIVGAGVMILYIWRITRDHNGFEKAFGTVWADQIPPELANRIIQTRWTWFKRMKASPESFWERNIAFWTIPNTDRQLLCDVWRPPNGDVSGLVFNFLHGGAWYMHPLVAQGHSVMDVAYRLCLEVNIYGMIGDVKHAITWMKANASRYAMNPEQIVLGGGSAGGHLALLAGYTPEHPE